MDFEVVSPIAEASHYHRGALPPQPVLVGSFCEPIKKFVIDESGKFQYQGEVPNSGPAPSYIIQSPCGRFMYCTVETAEAETSQVMSFRCSDVENTNFEFVSSQPAGGGAPCFLSVNSSNNYLFVSNYFGGNLTIFPVDTETGVLSPMCQKICFNMTLAPHLPFNRDSGHCHQTVHLERSQNVLVCELGQNAVYSFEFSPQPNCTSPHDVLQLSNYWLAPSGSGPRHLVVHPSERFAYVLSELSCTVMVVKIDPDTGRITSPSDLHDGSVHQDLVCHSTLREEERSLPTETICAAEILLSADARFLYISNRDMDIRNRDLVQDKFEQPTRCSIIVFAVVDEGSRLQPIQQVHPLGCHPRALSLIHGGTFLAVANKDEGHRSLREGGNFVMFPLNKETGMLISEEAIVSEDFNDVITQPTWLHLVRL